MKMIKEFKELLKDQSGQGMIEIALIIIFVVLAVSPFLTDLGSATGTKVKSITDKVNSITVP